MHKFDFLEPGSLHDASAMLADSGDECRVIAAGTALLLALRQRMLVPGRLISVAGIADMRGISYNPDKGLKIGALSTHAEIAASPVVREHFPMLADMAANVANPQVRNQGTIGGNLCYGDPQTDPPSTLLALNAHVMLSSTRGTRFVSIADFLVDYYTTALEPGELLVRVYIPAQQINIGRHERFRKTAAEHRPLVNVAIAGSRRGDVCEDARIVVGASTPVPARMSRAEQFLNGKTVTADVASDAAEIIASDAKVISDLRGDEAYRRDMIRVISRRTIETLFKPVAGNGAI